MRRMKILTSCLWLCTFGAQGHDLADIITAAGNGHVEAQYILGGMYEIGLGVARNNGQCAHWWQKAADQGHVDSQKALGSMYFSGRGVPLSYEKAMQFYLLAAEQGHPHAQKYVALGYRRGLGLPVDLDKSAFWQAKAAEQSGPESTVAFIEAFEQEETEVHSDEEIFGEFLRQAEKGTTRALFYVGAAYTAGIGVPQDYTEAEKWYRAAADLELHAGLEALGILYQLGQGVEQDRVEAHTWYLVAEVISPKFEGFLTEVNGRYMSAADKATARERADAWLAAREID
jgi:TPR repeat protein